MKRENYSIIVLLGLLIMASSAFAESKRVEVYSLSQNYWDTQAGETLGEIAAQLLPHNFNLQQKLMNDIVSQNPDAFQNNDPNYMLANTRLWLPNNLPQIGSQANPKRTEVETYSWGNIKRPKR
ncbi:MAG: hypothetical protein KAT90_04905 [Gammaproteobacteria bacterium]|nr:hypothetical protein [Gammaproteobacteria bacterium]